MAKKLTMKRRGDVKCRRSVFDDDVELGEIDFDDLDLDDAELDELLTRRGRGLDDSDVDTADEESDTMSERRVARFAARVGAPGLTLDEIRDRLSRASNLDFRDSDPSSHSLLLAEAVRGGKLDNARAAALARESKITLADYIAAQEAQKTLDLAVLQGKILPRDRAFFFRDALERPREFADWARTAPRVLALDSLGLGSAHALNIDDEMTWKVEL